jgi:hypothetical protein
MLTARWLAWIIVIAACFSTDCEATSIANSAPSVETVITGFCNVTGLAIVRDFSQGNLQLALSNPSVANVAALSATVTLTAATGWSVVLLDGGCNVAYIVNRNATVWTTYFNSTESQRRPFRVAPPLITIAAGTSPPTTLGGAIDGTGTAAQFFRPVGLHVVAAGELLTADS